MRTVIKRMTVLGLANQGDEDADMVSYQLERLSSSDKHGNGTAQRELIYILAEGRNSKKEFWLEANDLRELLK